MWCCNTFEEHIYKDSKPTGFTIMRGYKEPPHPGIQWFLLTYQSEGCKGASTMIHFCPWCGAELSSFPKPDLSTTNI